LRLLSFEGNFPAQQAMTDQEKSDGANSVRVIEDEVEEVIRLDAPKERVKVAKTGGIAGANFELPRGVVEEDVKEEVKPFDPEAAWLDISTDVQKRAVPMGWFYLLGAVFVGVLVWVGFQSSGLGEPLERQGLAGAADGSQDRDKPLGKEAEALAKDEAAEHYERTEEVLRGFLGGGTLEEKAKYVRHPERVIPLMKSFYSWNEVESISYDQIEAYQIYSMENLPFMVLEVADKAGRSYPVLLEDGRDGILVDWESFVCYQPMSVDEYASKRPTEVMTFRARVFRDFYYTYEFSNEEEFACYKLIFRDSDVVLHGYVKRGTELDKKFEKIYGDSGTGKMQSLILKMRFLEGGKAKNSVLIEDMVSTLWAYPADPAKVASSEE